MGRKCTVFNCRSRYKGDKFKGSVFGFPSNVDERQAWVNALPNRMKVSDITGNKGVCQLHWPKTYKKKNSNRWKVPAEPPSVFDVKPSCFQQTAPKKRRNINTRRVSQSAREATFELKKNVVDVDIIPDWYTFLGHCQNLKMPILTTDAGIILLGMSIDSPISLLYSIEISSEFNIKCYKLSSSIPCFKIT